VIPAAAIPTAAAQPIATADDAEISDAQEGEPGRWTSLVRSRPGFDIWIKTLIAIAIGLGAGLIVPFLLSR
jgi:hypothetical protein